MTCAMVLGFGLAKPALALSPQAVPPRPVVVAAENVYGAIAAQIAGQDADVTSILTNPAQDPHVFEPSPSAARLIARASITITNGAGYDPWMARLLRASPSKTRRDIVVAEASHAAPGANPHLWYQPSALLAGATALANALAAQDPPHAFGYVSRLSQMQADLAWVQGAMAALHTTYGAAPVAATEPVFDDIAAGIGLEMRDHSFAVAVMNGAEPRASDIAALETDLRAHKVRALIYDTQLRQPAVERMLAIAQQADVPVVGVSELLPAHSTYLSWMHGQLDALAAALARKPK